jgi:DNA invertase Pin-like site-specific DNA recombinase
MSSVKVKKKALHVKPGGALSSPPLTTGRAPKLPRVACYLRVSSRAQTLETQFDAVTRASTARGDHIATVYEEKVSTRVPASQRPELARLRMDAQAGKISKLYVFRIDRLTRSGIRDTFELVDELRRHGVELASVADGFDVQGPGGEIVLAVMAWAAHMERHALRERTEAARARIEAAGGSWGRPARRVPRALRQQILSLRSEGRSIRAIAIALKIPRATVGRAAKERLES